MNNKPTSIHEVTGAYKANSARRRGNEATPSLGIGPPPTNAKRSTKFKKVWNEIVDNICPGVLGNCDRLHLEITTVLMCEFRENPSGFNAAKLAQLAVMLGKLGMNPIDRIRIKITEVEKKTSKEDEYF